MLKLAMHRVGADVSKEFITLPLPLMSHRVYCLNVWALYVNYKAQFYDVYSQHMSYRPQRRQFNLKVAKCNFYKLSCTRYCQRQNGAWQTVVKSAWPQKVKYVTC